MPKLEPSKIAAKQLKRVRESVDIYEDGVRHPRANPIERALSKKAKWANKIQDAIKNDTWGKALSGLTFDDWQKPTVTVGPRHWVENVEAKASKIQRFWSSWAPLLDAHVSKLQAMKDETDADREARMLANLRGLKSLKGAWRGRR